MKTFLLLLLILTLEASSRAVDDVVQLSNGAKVKGFIGDGFRLFKAIPFAEAPSGKLRWKPPKPKAPWPGVLDATLARPCPRCPQITPSDNVLHTDEDCLLLNVYTPLAPLLPPPPHRPAHPNAATIDSALLPVIVFVHGGGFLHGSACEIPEINSSYLCQLTVADHSTSGGNQTSSPSSPSSSTGQQYKGGAVVIQPQYRLGVFGFLGGDALRTSAGAGAGAGDGGGKGGTSGNWGALDIQLALEWVRDNAKQFGGDPNKVMLAGQSAGAGMVGAITVMESSWGLYSAASLNSGAYGTWSAQPWSITEATLETMSNATGCNHHHHHHHNHGNVGGGADRAAGAAYNANVNASANNTAVQCLSKMDVGTLLTAANNSGTSFSPTPDGVELLALPWTSVEHGHVAKGVQFLIGSCAEDADANLTRSQYNLSTTRADYQAFVRSELPWANRTIQQLMLTMYLNDTGVPSAATPAPAITALAPAALAPTPAAATPAANEAANEAAGSRPGSTAATNHAMLDGSVSGLDRRLNASYSKWYWAAKHMLADAEMFCSNSKAARWINRANMKGAAAAAAVGAAKRGAGGVVAGYARLYMFAHVPSAGGAGSGAPHNGDTAFWFHVKDSPNITARLNSPAEVALSSRMAQWWLRTAASGDPNTHPATATATPAWPPFPLNGKGGAAAEPVMVMNVQKSGVETGSYVAYGARASHCEFWDRLSYAQTPED